jgi:FAD/FMN-containing dehydrogenase/Fe-S oxidoreductase
MMISRLTISNSNERLTTRFVRELQALGFQGEVDESHSIRTVLSTDNSIYQRFPKAALFPRNTEDVKLIAKIVGREEFRNVVVSPRGGGTGTNGQSLTDGIVVDLSRHMNRILEIDPLKRTARVEAGVVKDQLNAELKRHGLFFAPELSTSNRATIGGMISTDASGQGSCTYGKTRDHVIALEAILVGGDVLSGRSVDRSMLDAQCARVDRVGAVFRAARRISERDATLIQQKFPRLNRCLTGYDLAHLREDDGCFNINSVLCGAEGTLGFVVEATLNVLPIPKHAMLVNIRYASFMDALRDARALMQMRPLSIETVDSTVLRLARDDIVWQSVDRYFPADDGVEGGANGINLVEFSGDDEGELRSRVESFVCHLKTDTSVRRLGHTIAEGEAEINCVYAMRKRAVGLLGNARGASRPQPFVEDTAVPPENLADYIAEFRALLDSFGLRYGMFGHVDAGVLHVRPALDMRNEADAALVRPISDAVAALTIKYGGLLWGEHGKGIRSEYVPEYFGPLYPSLQELKAAFDPFNQLNPGKIATPSGSRETLLKIDVTPIRGDLDRKIDERVWQANSDAVHCNGNGACYNFDPDDAMCPSWKATRMRQHSPKGRASLMREWLRLQQQAGADLTADPVAAPFLVRAANSLRKRQGETDFSHEVYDAMAGCLSCKSCAGQCPVKVSVPDFRARFLELYHTRYLRPVRDHIVGALEFTVPKIASLPGGRAIFNALMQARPVQALLSRAVGMVDIPLLSNTPWQQVLDKWNAQIATVQKIAALSSEERQRSVILVQDAFTRYFDTPVATAMVSLASRLGYSVFVVPFRANGKPLHVQGLLPQFRRAAMRNAAQLETFAGLGVPLVGIDPAMSLVYRQEYRKIPSLSAVPEVLLPQEWLSQALRVRRPKSAARASFRLLPHCTERTNASASTDLWIEVFAAAGLHLATPASGCCGMSGTYGHEARNRNTSSDIFALSWARHVDLAGSDVEDPDELLATGYSCRCQVKRMRGKRLRHPIEVLFDLYDRAATESAST